MKLYDCSLYYDEDLILNARLNIINKYFDKFIIFEIKYTHSGRKKIIIFNINNFYEFKIIIIYVVNDKEPNNLIYKLKNGKEIESPEDYRHNAIKRIAFQRNTLMNAVNDIADPNDFIFYSDNDEIPNMKDFDQIKETNDIVIFEQKLFYYKFNLLFDRIYWYGTKAVRKKRLTNFEWLSKLSQKNMVFID